MLKEKTLKLISVILWFILSINGVIAIVIGMWLLSKMWPIYFWCLFGGCIIAIIFDFIRFREERKKLPQRKLFSDE